MTKTPNDIVQILNKKEAQDWAYIKPHAFCLKKEKDIF